jgi:hypothetical protein
MLIDWVRVEEPDYFLGFLVRLFLFSVSIAGQK